MILVRNVFRLKFGMAKEAVAHMKEGIKTIARLMPSTSPRVLTDLVTDFYTVVLEMTFDSLAAYEENSKAAMGEKDWQEWYQKFVPCVDSGHREVFTIAS